MPNSNGNSSTDVFGYSKTTHTGSIATFTDVVLSIGASTGGGGKLMLCQNIRLNYERQIQPIYGIGTADIWLSPLPATGRMEVSRAITATSSGAAGTNGMLKPYAGDVKCTPTPLTISEVKNDCGVVPGSVSASGLLSNVGVNIVAGQNVSVQDSAVWVLTDVKVKG